jgi:hypothetical protein
MRSFRAMIETPSQAIGLLGGAAAVSERTKRPLTTVASWVSRESIPVDAWPELIEMARGGDIKGITYETLAKAHPPRAGGGKRETAG